MTGLLGACLHMGGALQLLLQSVEKRSPQGERGIPATAGEVTGWEWGVGRWPGASLDAGRVPCEVMQTVDTFCIRARVTSSPFSDCEAWDMAAHLPFFCGSEPVPAV